MYTVLLVDDEPVVLNTERRIIERKIPGFEVIGEAFSVKRALEIYDRQKPDVVLTDIKMPVQSGLVLIQNIMERENNSTVCISVSGYTDFNYVHDSFTYGAMDYLLKPVEPAKMTELFERIRQVLDNRGELGAVRVLEDGYLTGRELVDKICIFLKDHLAEDNSILVICNKFGISQPYLSKIFKTFMGCTYNEYLTELRIERAKSMLREKKSPLIGEIAVTVGFADQFYFSKVFKNKVGCTPREYKQAEGSKNSS